MHTTRALSGGALLATISLMAAGAASGAASTTYTGEFGGDVVYENCTTAPPAHVATGDWSVTMHGTSAKGAFTIMFGTETHVDYTFPGMKQAPGNTESSWVVYGRTMAGLLTVTASGDTMSYVIAPYHYGGLSCDRVTFPGTVD